MCCHTSLGVQLTPESFPYLNYLDFHCHHRRQFLVLPGTVTSIKQHNSDLFLCLSCSLAASNSWSALLNPAIKAFLLSACHFIILSIRDSLLLFVVLLQSTTLLCSLIFCFAFFQFLPPAVIHPLWVLNLSSWLINSR